MDPARWWETDLTRTVLEWWYEDLLCQQPGTSPAVQALTRALWCAMLCRRCRDLCFQSVGSMVRFFSFSEHMVCNVDIRKNLYFNVVSLGGTTTFQGVVEHMTNEMTALAPSTMRSRWLLRFAGSQTVTSSLSRRSFPLCRSVVPTTFSQTETSSLSFRTFPVA